MLMMVNIAIHIAVVGKGSIAILLVVDQARCIIAVDMILAVKITIHLAVGGDEIFVIFLIAMNLSFLYINHDVI